MKRFLSIFLSIALVALCAAPGACAATGETVITLSDSGIEVDGKAASTDSSSAVYVGADIVYYEEGHDSSYGEGTAADAHTASEAAAHTVVTITEAGIYHISGKLSQGQIAIDLGADAAEDPTAVVTLILDGADITCTVAPAIIFYNVYECGTADSATASATVDTSEAGANVIIADGSINNVNGAYVARIYKEGTTKKLHKYDGAFYSKMSMNVGGESLGTGILNIVAENEGLDSELHLTINGGVINITAQDDGINTNEDGISVTTINAGVLYINAGLGSEGDGIDSNGYLVINGGTIVSLANPTSGDGGLDAEGDILINGGTVVAAGSRNDAASTSSEQAYMELFYATTKTAGTLIRVEDGNGNEIVTFSPAKNYQSVTISTPEMKLGTTYHVYSGGTITGVSDTNGLYKTGGSYTGGIQQQYSGNSSGMGGGMGGQIPADGIGMPADGFTPPEGTEGERPDDRTQPADGTGEMPADGTAPTGGERTMPNGRDSAGDAGGQGNQTNINGEASVDFTLTDTVRAFSGVSDAEDVSGKTSVTFRVNSGSGISSAASGTAVTLTDITAVTKSGGTAAAIAESDIQITITDIPSENYAAACLLSDGAAAITAILPTDDGTYQLTISVLSSNETYTGTSQWQFNIGGLPYTDVSSGDAYYDAIAFVYDAGIMAGTGNNEFSPNTTVTRAMAVTVLGRLADADTAETAAFSDVTSGSWYSAYVGWAVNNDIVAGYGDGTFGPEDTITRQQICLILANYLESAGISVDSAGASSYTDAPEVSDWAVEGLSLCESAGLLDGIASGDTLNPKAEVTRAELADLLMRLTGLA